MSDGGSDMEEEEQGPYLGVSIFVGEFYVDNISCGLVGLQCKYSTVEI